MKQDINKLLILFLSIPLLFTACKMDESADRFQPLDYYVKVKADLYDVSFNRHGVSQTVGSDAIFLTVSPANEELELSVSENWCHAEVFNVESAKYLKITVDANPAEMRTAKVSVMAGKGADQSGAIVNVSQETAFITPKVEADNPSIIFDKFGGKEIVNVSTNLESWDFEVANLPGESESLTWCQVVREGSSLILTAPDAGSVDLRGLKIILTAKDKDFTASSEVVVTQDKTRKMVAGIELIFVEGGTFLMGCDPGDVGYVAPTSKVSNSPKHSVTLSDYYIGKFEVTQKQYYDIMGTNPSVYPLTAYTGSYNGQYNPTKPETALYANYPVEMTTWAMAMAFCEKANELYGSEGVFCLPTEAQWEYAARGGKHINENKRLLYAGSNDINLVGISGSGSGTEKISRTAPVGQYQPNELGIYDMSGNVLEYVYDFMGPYPNEHVTDPTGPTSPVKEGVIGNGNHHVLKGGSYWHKPTATAWTAYARGGNTNANYIGAFGFTGFRVAFKRTLPTP